MIFHTHLMVLSCVENFLGLFKFQKHPQKRIVALTFFNPICLLTAFGRVWNPKNGHQLTFRDISSHWSMQHWPCLFLRIAMIMKKSYNTCLVSATHTKSFLAAHKDIMEDHQNTSFELLKVTFIEKLCKILLRKYHLQKLTIASRLCE